MAPLVIFTYNRPEHTSALLESLRHVAGAESTELFVFSDGAKTPEDAVNVREVRSLLASFQTEGVFKSVEIRESEANCGLAHSIITGVTEIISKYGDVIVLEDDLVVNRNFLQFMNCALDCYSSDNRIWAVSGYTFPMEEVKNDVYFSGRACSWGWATWSDRWDKVDWKVKDYPSFRRNIRKRKDFGRWGADMPDMLDRCMLGDIHSWAIRWCYSAWKERMLTVYPKESFVVNNGTDGSGTNFNKKEDRFDTFINNDAVAPSFVEPYFDEKIRIEFRKRYMTFPYLCKIMLRVFFNQFRKIHR